MAEIIYDESINDSIRPRFLSYAQSVLQDRAIPSGFDGLKPIHRRILMSFYEQKLLNSTPYRKSAKVVGYCLSEMSPHGDQSAYDALVGLAQDFNMRYPLVDGSGNYGSINGTPAAAMRYTESRLSQYGELMCQDVETLADQKDNFDNSRKEPIDLATYFPNLLMNGTNGIAVGLATKFAPHYAKDIYNAILYIIDCRIKNVRPDIEKIIDIIKAPDFPTGAQITNGLQVRNIYKTGKGPVTLRAKFIIDKNSIIYTEIPYKVTPNSIVQAIAGLNISEIKDVRDETSKRTGIRIVVELKKGTNPDWIVNKLFKETPLQSNFNVNMVAIMDNRPETDLNILKILCYYLSKISAIHNKKITLEIESLQDKLFKVNTMLTAIEHIKEIIDYIQTMDIESAKYTIADDFFSNDDEGLKAAEYVLSLRLSTLSKTSKEDLEDKRDKYNEELGRLNQILSTPQNFLTNLAEKFKEIRDSKIFKNDKRRTEILNLEINSSQDIRDFIKNESVVITYTNKGMIKAVRSDEYKTSKRNTMGVKPKTLREDEFITNMLTLDTHDNLLLFSDLGRCYLLPVYKLPIVSKNAASKSINNFVNLVENETILKIIALTSDVSDKSILIVSKFGYVKRMLLSLLAGSRVNTVGTRVVTLSEEDRIKAVNLVNDDDDIIIFTNSGRGLKFNISDPDKPIRLMGKNARGNRNIKLAKDEYVVNAMPIPNVKISSDKDNDNSSVIIVSENGYGKRLLLKQLKQQKRNQTPINYMAKTKVGPIVNGIFISDNEELLIATKQGQTVRINVDDIKPVSRIAAGIMLIKFKDADDKVVSISSVKKDFEDEQESPN